MLRNAIAPLGTRQASEKGDGALLLGMNLNRSKFRPPEMPIFLGLDLDTPKITFFLF